MLRKTIFLFCFLILLRLPASGETPNPATLIIPGKSVGPIRLGANAVTDKAVKALGKPDGGRGGGDDLHEWYLGAQRGDKGRPFHRPASCARR